METSERITWNREIMILAQNWFALTQGWNLAVAIGVEPPDGQLQDKI